MYALHHTAVQRKPNNASVDSTHTRTLKHTHTRNAHSARYQSPKRLFCVVSIVFGVFCMCPRSTARVSASVHWARNCNRRALFAVSASFARRARTRSLLALAYADQQFRFRLRSPLLSSLHERLCVCVWYDHRSRDIRSYRCLVCFSLLLACVSSSGTVIALNTVCTCAYSKF